MVHRN